MIEAPRRPWRAAWQSVLGPAALLLVLMGGLAVLGSVLIHNHVQANAAAALAQQEQLAEGGMRTGAQIVERTLDLTRTAHSIANLARNYHLRGEGQNAAPVEAILTDLAREERSGILQIAMIDESGQLVFSSVPGWRRMDLSDREHFRVHREGLHEPFISAPLVGRASGRWSVQVTRPIFCDISGEFAGVVVVSVDPLEISAALRQSHFGSGAFTSLSRGDGTILARSHDAERFLGQRIPDATLDMLRDLPNGVGPRISPLTGEEVTVAWRMLADWPLVVWHGLPRAPLAAAAAAQRAELHLRLATGLAAMAALYVAFLFWRARRRATEAMARVEASRREIADLVGALPGAAYRGLASPGGPLRLTQTTEGLLRLTGAAPGEGASSMDWAHLLDAEGRQSRARHLAATIAQRENVAEYRLRHADGRWIWVRDHARARRTAAPGQAEIVGVLSDITQEREMAAQAVGTAKLATLGEMATGLAHELNQPASAIALAADLAAIELESADPVRHAKARGRLQMIVRQIMRMREIVQHLQIFARTDPQSTRMDAVSLDEAVNGALGLVHGTLNASGVALHADLPPGLPPVLGQLVPLEQVLVNLLLNARDAMESTAADQREVHITARADAAKGEVRLYIRDTGPGFTPEQQARALEPFYTTKPPGKGTGLGLAIAYGTLRTGGGSIAVGNSPAGGAELVLHLRGVSEGRKDAMALPEPATDGACA
jgi:PAS domain S-box-containing protein